MSNVIEFLERMGQDASLRHASRGQIQIALTDTALDDGAKTGILNGNQRALETLLDVKSNVCCMIYPVDEAPTTLSM